jgi:NADH-quinone oxidoreductase subunit L
MLVIAALFTSFYSWRLMFLTFFGKARGDKHTHEHAHESPMVMLVPLGVLAVGSIFVGAIWYSSFFGKTNEVASFFGVPYAEASEHGDAKDDHSDEAKDDHAEAKDGKAKKTSYEFTGKPGEGAIYTGKGNHVIHDAHYVPIWVKLSPFIAMVIGLILAMWFYIWNPAMPKRVMETNRPLYQFLLNKWYFDEIYDYIFVQPAKMIGRFLWKRGDGDVIDGTLNGVAMGIVPFFTRLAGRAQSGYIFTYAFAMVIGILVLITWMTFSGGAQ